MKTLSRRDALLGTLFGAGMLGLRSLATGLPVQFLANPRRALADMTQPTCSTSTAQFVIFNTSNAGDPMGSNAPGTYDDPVNGIDLSAVPHPTTFKTPQTVMLGGRAYKAAAPWATLTSDTLSRACFCHFMTNTPVHPKEPEVLRLMGAVAQGEMLPSLLSRSLAPCLGTLQAQPVVLAPGAAVTFGGQPLPVIPPSSLQALMLNPAGELTTPLQPLRDKTLDKIYDVYKNGASPAQRAYLDAMITSRDQARNIPATYLTDLGNIADDTADSQIAAAVILIKMKIAPVFVVNIPFGEDNHTDPTLAIETADTLSGVQSIVSLMSALQQAQLADQVSLVTLNVFGRTMRSTDLDGRDHNPLHQMSLMIGKPFRGGVVGGIGPMNQTGGAKDFGALPIDSTSGHAVLNGGDIQPIDSLASFGKTILTACGVDPAVASSSITNDKAKVIQGALV